MNSLYIDSNSKTFSLLDLDFDGFFELCECYTDKGEYIEIDEYILTPWEFRGNSRACLDIVRIGGRYFGKEVIEWRGSFTNPDVWKDRCFGPVKEMERKERTEVYYDFK